jgi:hypothetical protein
METPPTCPRCHSDEVVPTAYGMPAQELLAEPRKGRVALGDFVAWPEAPGWRCVTCGFQWRDEELPDRVAPAV